MAKFGNKRKTFEEPDLTKRLATEAGMWEDSEGHPVLVYLLLPPGFSRRTLVAHKIKPLSIVTILIFYLRFQTVRGLQTGLDIFKLLFFFFRNWSAMN